MVPPQQPSSGARRRHFRIIGSRNRGEVTTVAKYTRPLGNRKFLLCARCGGGGCGGRQARDPHPHPSGRIVRWSLAPDFLSGGCRYPAVVLRYCVGAQVTVTIRLHAFLLGDLREGRYSGLNGDIAAAFARDRGLGTGVSPARTCERADAPRDRRERRDGALDCLGSRLSEPAFGCEGATKLPALQHHQQIEFSNRIVSGLTVFLAVATWLLSRWSPSISRAGGDGSRCEQRRSARSACRPRSARSRSTSTSIRGLCSRTSCSR